MRNACDVTLEGRPRSAPLEKTPKFAEVAAAMARIDFCMLQTFVAGGVNTRPMSNNGDVEYDGDNWFFARAGSTKMAELHDDRRVQLTFADNDAPSFISVWGTASIVDDIELKQRMWHASLERWFENGPEDPEVALIRVTAERIQTWGRVGDFVLE